MGVGFRQATAADYGAFAQLFPELRVSDPLPSVDYFAQRMVPRVTLAVDALASVGYAFFQPYGATAHIVHVVVRPAFRGRRVGEALLEEVRRLAATEGCHRLYLNVKRENASALRLYERWGLREESSSWALRLKWAEAGRLEPCADADVFTPEPSDDRELGQLFGMDRERLALLRSRPATQLRALRERGKPVAVAGFTPAHPGAYPFRTVRPALAGALLAAIRPLAFPEHDYLHIAVEEDERLARTLLAAGGELVSELARLGRAI